MDEKVKIIERGRGCVALYKGHQYYRKKTYKNGSGIWKCKNYKHLRCNGTLTLDPNETILKFKTHCESCHPDETQNIIDVLVNNACEEAVEGREPAPKVFNKTLTYINEKGLDLASTKPIPSFQQKKTAIYRRRNNNAGVKKICTLVADEVEVPIQYASFLLADYKEGDMRILVFCSNDSKNEIKDITHFFMDGTFKSCPKPFRQLFTIHGDIGSDINSKNIIPMMYCFMTHQSKEAYVILFRLIQAQIREWQPLKVTIDFEDALIAALNELDSRIMVKGCHYHFSNALTRKAKKFNIYKKQNIKRIISLCSNLAYLPENNIAEGWAFIKEELHLEDRDDGVEKFKKYFEEFWLRPKMVKMWCIYSEPHRTNNAVEGWNYKMNTLINKNKGNLLQILHCLYDDARIASFRRNQLNNFGATSQPKRRRVDREKDGFIINIQMQLICGDITVHHFLDKILAYSRSH